MLSILIVDDDPLLCAAMQRKIQIVDQGNGLGVQEVEVAHSVQEEPFPSGNSAGGVKWL